MRGLWRNGTFRRGSLALLVLSAVLTAAGFLVSPAAGGTAAACCAVFYIFYALSCRRRFRLMGGLAGELDAILHGQESFDLDRFSEGELSILQSELSKLLITLRRQSESLSQDKVWLASSLADISHQLKTPLTSMNLAAAMLAGPDPDPERRRELARDLSRQLTRLEWLVSALLKISRLDAGMADMTRSAVTVRELVDLAAEPILIPLELREVSLVRDYSGGESLVCDPAWTAEALGNILKNCMEHTPPGGTVTVSARENAIYTQLTVSDTGPGIDPEDLPHVFERFYRGKNADPGSAGIGLALARAIVQSSGGTVKAENTPGGGALFTLRFYKSTV